MTDLKRSYKTLGLRPNSSLQAVEKAYHDLTWKRNPERFAYDTRLKRRAQELQQELDEAYGFLSEHPHSNNVQPALVGGEQLVMVCVVLFAFLSALVLLVR